MKLCIPTMDDKGLEGMLSDHFGSAPFFTIVDTESGEVETLQNGGSDHAHGACMPLEFLGAQTVDALCCRGLGRRTLAKLQAVGVQVFVTLEGDVEKTLAAFKEGKMRQMSADEACQGHSGGGSGHSHGGQGHFPGGQGGGGRWQ